MLAAVRELVVEQGYNALSFEGVARRAGVTRPTLYRRWPSKAHLVHDAVFRVDGRRPTPAPDTGSFAADVERMVRATIRVYDRPEVRAALAGLIADLHGDRDHRRAVVGSFQGSARRDLAEIVRRGVARGEVRDDVDADALFDTIVGAVAFRLILRGRLPGRFAEALTRVVLEGTTRVDPSDRPSGARRNRTARRAR